MGDFSLIPGVDNGSTADEISKLGMFSQLFAPKFFKSLQAALVMLSVVLGWISLPLRFFFRVMHGERSTSLLAVINAYAAIQLSWFVITAAQIFISEIGRVQRGSGGSTTIAISAPARNLYLVAFLIAAAYHLYRIAWRRKHGILIYSYTEGHSILEVLGLLDWANDKLKRIRLFGRWKIPFRLNRWHLYLYLEPAMGFAIAQIVYLFDPVLAMSILFASVALFINAQLTLAVQRHALLDYWDSHIRADAFRDAAIQKSPEETSGIMVIPGFAQALEHAEKLDIAKRVNETVKPHSNGESANP